MCPIDQAQRIGIKIAQYGNVKRAKVAALAFSKSGELIASSHNRRRDATGQWTEHAEEGLLRKLHKLRAFVRYKKITILVLRISSYGITMAKPCKHCRKLLAKHNVEVLYSDYSGTIQCLRTDENCLSK